MKRSMKKRRRPDKTSEQIQTVRKMLIEGYIGRYIASTLNLDVMTISRIRSLIQDQIA